VGPFQFFAPQTILGVALRLKQSRQLLGARYRRNTRKLIEGQTQINPFPFPSMLFFKPFSKFIPDFIPHPGAFKKVNGPYQQIIGFCDPDLPIFPSGKSSSCDAQKFGEIIDFNVEIFSQKSDFGAG
jgi:hypothetical protein